MRLRRELLAHARRPVRRHVPRRLCGQRDGLLQAVPRGLRLVLSTHGRAGLHGVPANLGRALSARWQLYDLLPSWPIRLDSHGDVHSLRHGLPRVHGRGTVHEVPERSASTRRRVLARASRCRCDPRRGRKRAAFDCDHRADRCSRRHPRHRLSCQHCWHGCTGRACRSSCHEQHHPRGARKAANHRHGERLEAD